MLEDIYLSLSMGAVLIDGAKILLVVSVAMRSQRLESLRLMLRKAVFH